MSRDDYTLEQKQASEIIGRALAEAIKVLQSGQTQGVSVDGSNTLPDDNLPPTESAGLVEPLDGSPEDITPEAGGFREPLALPTSDAPEVPLQIPQEQEPPPPAPPIQQDPGVVQPILERTRDADVDIHEPFPVEGEGEDGEFLPQDEETAARDRMRRLRNVRFETSLTGALTTKIEQIRDALASQSQSGTGLVDLIQEVAEHDMLNHMRIRSIYRAFRSRAQY